MVESAFGTYENPAVQYWIIVSTVVARAVGGTVAASSVGAVVAESAGAVVAESAGATVAARSVGAGVPARPQTDKKNQQRPGSSTPDQHNQQCT
jgi:hypothetical protein